MIESRAELLKSPTFRALKVKVRTVECLLVFQSYRALQLFLFNLIIYPYWSWRNLSLILNLFVWCCCLRFILMIFWECGREATFSSFFFPLVLYFHLLSLSNGLPFIVNVSSLCERPRSVELSDQGCWCFPRNRPGWAKQLSSCPETDLPGGC